MTINPKASLAIGIFCIAFSPIFVKAAGVPALTSGFYRIAIGWVCLAPYCFIRKKLKIGTKELLIAMLGGIVFATDIAVWNLSLMKISATVSTLVANLAPVWVGLFGFLLFRQKAGVFFWLGTAVAIIGMVVLVGYQHVIHLQFNLGILLALLASLLYACYIMITKGILQKIETITFMFYNMLAASVFLMLICFADSDALSGFSGKSWGCLLGMGLICQLTGWITINYSLKFLPSTRVSIVLLSQTVIAGFLAALFLSEHLAFTEIGGSVVVLGGIALSFLGKAVSVKKVE